LRPSDDTVNGDVILSLITDSGTILETGSSTWIVSHRANSSERTRDRPDHVE